MDLTKGQITGERVQDAAFRLFVARGYHGTSMRDIANASGLAAASIYNHFHSKEEIFRQILVRHHPYHQMIPALEAARGDTVEALVNDAAKHVYTILRTRKELMHLFFIEVVEFEGRHLKKILIKAFPQILNFLGRIQKARGELRPIPPTSILLTLVGIVLSQWMMEAAFFKNIPMPVASNHFENSIDIYLHGILAPER
jgi:AcrR family transcriptional regulator